MTSYSARVLSKYVFRLVIYNLLEYSIKEAYNDPILQGVGGNDGTGYHMFKHNILYYIIFSLNSTKKNKGEIVFYRERIFNKYLISTYVDEFKN
jgi:hypothetical protein